ncbi:MAG: ComEC family competence protein [Alphaproteobacteria bacterium]|nr:ComEC family competence protein [Alphaproteobacteria bacterium]
MEELQNKFLSIWYAERPRWILWIPVFIGTGVGIYFSLPNEPSLPPLWLSVFAFALLAYWGFYNQKTLLGNSAILAMCIALGLSVAAQRTAYIAAPIIERQLYPQTITGVVAEITTRPETTRLTLENAVIKSLSHEDTPKYITVSLRSHADKAIELGDKIELRAGFFPPPKPVIAGGFAFHRHFFFKQIGAMGYAIGSDQPKILIKARDSTSIASQILQKRHDIAQWLIQHMSKREGAVAAALMVGESRAIPPDIYESMRQSGLVHVLSISGMHLTLAAGIFFFSARLIFAAIPQFAARCDTKKYAAIVALIGTFIYLLLAGMPISAQRSFVMVALVLSAVMISRTVTPVRSLCMAATLLLVFTPESLLNPGFQLSFAATLAILAYYERWIETRNKLLPEEWNWKQKQKQFWNGIVATSTVATFATMPFILHHFEGLPLYSVLANLVVMPLASFWIMPMVVLVLVTLPLGIAGWFLPVLKWGISMMLAMAQWIVTLPYAILDTPPLSTPWLVVITFGGLWLCLWQTRWRYLGVVPMLAGLMSLGFYHPPDMVISADAKKIAVRTSPDTITMLRGQRRGFTQDGWKRFLRTESYELLRKANSKHIRCDDRGCIYTWNGQEIAFSYHRATLQEDCAKSDMVITPLWPAYYDTQSFCGHTKLYDKSWLAKMQGVSFWITPERIHYKSVLETLGNRPWSQRSTTRN